MEASITRTAVVVALRRGARVLALLAFLAVSLAVLDAGSARADSGVPSGWIAYDEPPARLSLFDRLLDGVRIQPLIKYVTDCDGVGDTPDCGGTPARWAASSIPVRVCTGQRTRPAGMTAEEFREVLTRVAETWNSQEIAVGLDYVGDCTTSDTWQFNNLQNEVGWDDQRNVLGSTQAGVTRTSYSVTRIIRESDIVLDVDLGRVSRVCLESTLAHEFGHFLGLGHSDDRADLMFPSFDPNVLSTCKVRPTANERARLQALYGVDRSPSVVLAGGAVEPGSSVTAIATGTDPEGRPLTYRWTQTAGPAVNLNIEGATARFTAPMQLDTSVTLKVTAIDAIGHPATASATFVVNRSAGVPAKPPSLDVFAASGGNAVLGWGAVADAATYELCSRPVEVPAPFECAPVGSPRVPVSWDTVLGTVGRAGETRLITTGTRETFLRACNPKGCSPAGTGGRSGGVRWATSNIDYDYFALGYDVGAIQFTIVGVVNVSGDPRSFTLASGSEADPQRTRITACGEVAPGATCFGFLGPAAPGAPRHGDFVSILAEAAGRPTIEHRFRVR
jgi:Matrixin